MITSLESFVLLFDALALFVVWRVWRHLNRKPDPIDNWRPSFDDSRSGRRITLFMRPRR